MYQETGETRDAIIEDDNKRIQDIVAANKSRLEKYWIVVFAKPSKNSIEGKPILVKHIKAYGVKPIAQVGMICGEVDNSKGTIHPLPKQDGRADGLRGELGTWIEPPNTQAVQQAVRRSGLWPD